MLLLCHGVKQGYVLAPTLLTLYLGAVLETVGLNLSKDVYLRTLTDHKLFTLSPLKAHNKTRDLCMRELPFADYKAYIHT